MEGAVIVGSILLAVGIEAWWDGNHDREQEAARLGSVSADIRLNLDSLKTWRDTLNFAQNRSNAHLQLTALRAHRFHGPGLQKSPFS